LLVFDLIEDFLALRRATTNPIWRSPRKWCETADSLRPMLRARGPTLVSWAVRADSSLTRLVSLKERKSSAT
jgi:hypothetical protein